MDKVWFWRCGVEMIGMVFFLWFIGKEEIGK